MVVKLISAKLGNSEAHYLSNGWITVMSESGCLSYRAQTSLLAFAQYYKRQRYAVVCHF